MYTRSPQPSAPTPPPSSLSSTDPVSPLASNSLHLRKDTHSYTTQHPIDQFASTSSLSLSLSCFISHHSSASIPKTVEDALTNSGWTQAMELEMETLHQNET